MKSVTTIRYTEIKIGSRGWKGRLAFLLGHGWKEYHAPSNGYIVLQKITRPE